MLIDVLLVVASLTAVAALVVTIDEANGGQVARAISSAPSEGRVAVQMRDEAMTVARSVWDMGQMHAPLTTFAAVGAVLVLFMLRTT